MAQGYPGRTFSLMAIEMGLDFAGEVAPRDPAGGGVGAGTKDPDEVVGVLLGVYLHPLRRAAVGGRINAGGRFGQSDRGLLGPGEGVAGLLLMLVQLGEPLCHGNLVFDSLLEPPLL